MATDSRGLASKEGRYITHSLLVTPEIASRWLESCHYPRQRPLRRAHVAFLAEAMRRGEFKRGTTVEFRVLDGKRFLTDGQHRLTAIVASGIPQPMVTLEAFASSMEEVNADYARTDRGTPRSLPDVLAAHGLSDAMEITRSQVDKFSAAAIWLAYGLKVTRMGTYLHRSSEARNAVMVKWIEEARAFFDALRGGQQGLVNRLQSAPCMAVALVTLRHQPPAGGEFWSRVAHNDGLRRNEGAGLLADFLRDNTITSRGGNHYARAVAAAWGAHFEGRNMARLLVKDPLDTIDIAGTPYRHDRPPILDPIIFDTPDVDPEQIAQDVAAYSMNGQVE